MKVKRYHASLAGKITVFILCVISAAAAVAAVLNVVFLEGYGLISASEETFRRACYNLDDRFLPLMEFSYNTRDYAWYALAAAVLLFVVLFIILMCMSGRKKGSEEVCPGYLNAVPFDVMLACYAAAAVGFIYICDGPRGYFYINGYFNVPFTILSTVGMLTLFCLFLGLCMSLAARLKQGTLFKKLFIVWLAKFIWRIVVGLIRGIWKAVKAVGKGIAAVFRSIPQVWAIYTIAAVLLIADLILSFSVRGMSGFLTVLYIVKLIVATCAVLAALQMRRLQNAGKAIASGDLEYHVETDRMFKDFREHGEDLNNIASGMNVAVEDRIKSERMKTELITNVSHDLKTPLTSIVSYSELISKENTKNEKIKEYSEVLLRQSQRLKRLIEDLVEASKASTGNLDVVLVPCDPSVFLQQAGGEYEDRLKEAGLELIEKLPEKDIKIMADGRRMQRIFDNLMSNVCKYSQSGTRVYMSLDEVCGKALITIKNTSAAQLDVSGSDLMERFVRGDASRNTEGSGLGLSIAKSLAELQGGTLSVSVDGDLFKVILSFPVISE